MLWCIAAVAALLREAGDLREQLVAALTQALLGDTLAANYLLCHLISTVYVLLMSC